MADVAIYHFSAKTVSRAGGRSSVAAAAYRSAGRIIDERTGEIHDYTRKGGVAGGLVVLPGGGTMPRAVLWNAVEEKHKRGDAIVAREFVVALPDELDAAQREDLACGYARELADMYSVAVDINVHAPGKEGDQRNHHAHILMSACYSSPEGVMGKKAVELDPIHCQRAKIENSVEVQRMRWQLLVNEALERAGREEKVDHRTLEAQGIKGRMPGVHLGPQASAIQRRGQESQITQRERAKVAELVAMAQAGAVIEQAQAKNIEEMEKELAQLIAERDRPTRTRSVEEIGLQLKPLEGKFIDAKRTLFNAEQARPRALEKVKVEEAIAKSQTSKKRLQELEKQRVKLSSEMESTPWWRPFKKAKLEKTIPKVGEELASVKKQADKFQDMAARPIIENIDAAEQAARQVIDQAQPTIAELQNELQTAARARAELEAAAATKAQELALLRQQERAAEHSRLVSEMQAAPGYQAEKKARARALELERERQEAQRTRGPAPRG